MGVFFIACKFYLSKFDLKKSSQLSLATEKPALHAQGAGGGTVGAAGPVWGEPGP